MISCSAASDGSAVAEWTSMGPPNPQKKRSLNFTLGQYFITKCSEYYDILTLLLSSRAHIGVYILESLGEPGMDERCDPKTNTFFSPAIAIAEVFQALCGEDHLFARTPAVDSFLAIILEDKAVMSPVHGVYVVTRREYVNIVEVVGDIDYDDDDTTFCVVKVGLSRDAFVLNVGIMRTNLNVHHWSLDFISAVAGRITDALVRIVCGSFGNVRDDLTKICEETGCDNRYPFAPTFKWSADDDAVWLFPTYLLVYGTHGVLKRTAESLSASWEDFQQCLHMDPGKMGYLDHAQFGRFGDWDEEAESAWSSVERFLLPLGLLPFWRQPSAVAEGLGDSDLGRPAPRPHTRSLGPVRMKVCTVSAEESDAVNDEGNNKSWEHQLPGVIQSFFFFGTARTGRGELKQKRKAEKERQLNEWRKW